MNSIKKQWVILLLFFLAFPLFPQEISQTATKRELFTQLSLLQEGKELWCQKENHSVSMGKPIFLQIKSDKIVAIIQITLYPKSEGSFFVSAQAEVAHLDSGFRVSRLHQVRKSFLLKKEGKLLFYPFGNPTSFQQGSDSLAELKLMLSLSPFTSK